MPTRLIRDEMLESEAVLSLPVEARWFYVSILLSADDIGLFEATTFKLTRRADIRRDHGERYMEMLVDADLVRLYLVDGKRFGFIPKFRQRLQIKRLRYPAPPLELVRDDEDALNKINNLTRDPTVGQPLDNGCATVAQPSEPEPEPELKPKPKSQTERRERTPAVGKPTDVEPEVWQSWLVIRKAKRLPLTDLAMLAVRREAVNAGISLNQALTTCCERGWGSFKAEWIQNLQQPQQRFTNQADIARVTVSDQGAAEATKRMLAERERNTAPPPAEVRAKMAELLGHIRVKS